MIKLVKPSLLVLCSALSACSLLGGTTGEAPGSRTASAGPAGAVASPEVDEAWFKAYEARLQAALQGSAFRLSRHESAWVVTAPVEHTFNPDRPEMLLPVSLGPISRVAKLLENDPSSAVMVLGHTDASGSDQLNQTLSSRRASAVGAIFSLSGLKTDRLMIKGMGASMPLLANASKQNQARNRRVEMVVSPKKTFRVLVAMYRNPEQSADLLRPMMAPVGEETQVAMAEAATPVKKAPAVSKTARTAKTTKKPVAKSKTTKTVASKAVTASQKSKKQ